MKTPALSGVVLALLTTALLCAMFHSYSAAAQNSPTVVEVHKSTHGVAYNVDSRPADLTPTTSLLHLLALVHEKRGAGAPVVVLLDAAVPINQIWNVDGTAGKAQLTNVRYFIVDRDTQKMVEIKWGPILPYSKDPLVDRDTSTDFRKPH